MNNPKLSPLQQLLSEKLNNAQIYAQRTITKAAGLSNFKRDDYYQEINESLTSFSLEPNKKNYWIIMGGLRGVGKTTLLCQLYLEWLNKLKGTSKIFFLSLDEACSISANFIDIERVIENELGEKMHNYQHPLYIFLDEVHFIDKWSINAKIWHDRLPQLFLLCTGSSAISFWTNADIARRARIINIHPLSLSELTGMKIIRQPNYGQKILKVGQQAMNKKIAKLKLESHQITSALRQCFQQPQNAESTFKTMLAQNKKLVLYINKLKEFDYTQGLNYDLIVYQYINLYMSLPYAIPEIEYSHQSAGGTNQVSEIGVNEEAIRSSITRTLENIFNKDLNVLHAFSQATRAVFPDLLLMLAHNDTTELSSLSKKLKINIQTIQAMLKVLTNSGVAVAVPPLGASRGKISKPYKYLFTSPAIRQVLSPTMIQKDGSSNAPDSSLKGKLLEDVIYASFKRIFNNPLTDPQIEYDAASGGADFIIMPRSGIKQDALVVETGYNKKSHQQVEKTLERVGGQGMVITNTNQPRLVKDQPIVYVPLRLFLMT